MDSERVKQRFRAIEPYLDERLRRLVAAAEALSAGHGGVTMVSKATGVSRRAIAEGIKEIKNPTSPARQIPPSKQRVRKPGGGRKRSTEKIPGLLDDLEDLIEPATRGCPESPLRWTCKSVRRLRDELRGLGHKVSHELVAGLLKELGYSLQANKKMLEGSSHVDRNAQFEHINDKALDYQGRQQPVISVDTKKRELVGDFKNAGQEYRPKGNPEKVRMHDFADKELGKASPYGIYDIAANIGWVNVGTDNDTAAFAVESIRGWWKGMGARAYPQATQLLITADAGGSNGYRLRLWKHELQELANETGLAISVCHFPPGTSKWNKIEHRLFSFITQNWRGRPLISHEVIVNLIGATTTRTGLRVTCTLDTNEYPKGIKISDEQMARINLEPARFHGEWNYTIRPNSQADEMVIS